MTPSSLSIAAQAVLQQGCVFLDCMADEVYARPLPVDCAASIGKHYRHVLDHFLCLREGIRTGKVNYDQRDRDPQLENSVAASRFVTEDLLDQFGSLSDESLNRECAVTYSVAYGDDDLEGVPSNVAREVMFCIGHAIHHYAILKLLCSGVGVTLPREFGIAPSTLKHLRGERWNGLSS
ncbi:MAG: DinB family protein [Candidatus Sulfotelmatobacter sp.]